MVSIPPQYNVGIGGGLRLGLNGTSYPSLGQAPFAGPVPLQGARVPTGTSLSGMGAIGTFGPTFVGNTQHRENGGYREDTATFVVALDPNDDPSEQMAVDQPVFVMKSSSAVVSKLYHLHSKRPLSGTPQTMKTICALNAYLQTKTAVDRHKNATSACDPNHGPCSDWRFLGYLNTSLTQEAYPLRQRTYPVVVQIAQTRVVPNIWAVPPKRSDRLRNKGLPPHVIPGTQLWLVWRCVDVGAAAAPGRPDPRDREMVKFSKTDKDQVDMYINTALHPPAREEKKAAAGDKFGMVEKLATTKTDPNNRVWQVVPFAVFGDSDPPSELHTAAVDGIPGKCIPVGQVMWLEGNHSHPSQFAYNLLHAAVAGTSGLNRANEVVDESNKVYVHFNA